MVPSGDIFSIVKAHYKDPGWMIDRRFKVVNQEGKMMSRWCMSWHGALRFKEFLDKDRRTWEPKWGFAPNAVK